MGDLWGTLVPLIIGSALVPVQIVITAMLLRSKAGRITAVGLVAGMTVVRLVQGVVFGFFVGNEAGATSSAEGPGGRPRCCCSWSPSCSTSPPSSSSWATLTRTHLLRSGWR